MKKSLVCLCVLTAVLSLPAMAVDQHKGLTIDLSGAFLTRAAGSNVPLVSTDHFTPGTGDIFSTDTVALKALKIGGDLKVGYVWGKWGVEVRGFALAKGNKASAYTNDGIGSVLLSVDMAEANGYGLLGGGSLTATNKDDKALWGFEANGTYQLTPKVLLYAGLRYMMLSQSFNLYGTFDTDYQTDLWTTENKLFGGQVGANVNILGRADDIMPGWILNGHGAFALLSNSMDDAFVSIYDDEEAWAAAAGSAHKITPAVDAGLRGAYRLNRLLEFHVSYDLLWVARVAQADYQLTAMEYYNNTAMTPVYKSFLLHGIKAGVTLYF